MKTILIHSDVRGADKFRETLSARMEGLHVALSPDEAEYGAIEVVIFWLCVPDYLFRLPNLKLLLVCGSGVDHIINSPDLPHNVPLVRLVDGYLRDYVSDYVVRYIFKHFFTHTDYSSLEAGLVEAYEINARKKPKIGIMGLGLVGSSTAEKLLKMGFEVCGWVRSSRSRQLQEVYIGKERLEDFAVNCEVLVCQLPCEVLVCQLPLTSATRGILNNHLFGLLPIGAYLINVGRGGHLVEADLLPALEKGKLSGACVDVSEFEPLPAGHPFHDHPGISVTPHFAAETQAPYAVRIIHSCYLDKRVPGRVDYQANH